MSKKEKEAVVEVDWLKIIFGLCGIGLGFLLAIKFFI